MATSNSTPFLHQYLYRDNLPSCMLTCFATCVLYTNRTIHTTSIVLRTLDQNVQELIVVPQLNDNHTIHAKLARVQALFIYQIIRLFDGDVSLRSMAEKDLTLLESWVDDLCACRDNLSEQCQAESITPIQQPFIEWKVKTTAPP